MKSVRATGAAALFLLLGASVAAYAQHDQQNEKRGKPEKQQGGQPEGRKQQGAPPREQGQARGPQHQGQPQDRQHAQSAHEPQQQQRAQQQRQPQPQRVQQSQQQRPQQQEQRPQQARQQQQPQRPRQQAVAWQQKRGWVQKGAWREHSTWQQGRARRWEDEHRTWAQRGGYGGFYIPQVSFSLSFGDQHFFRMRARPTMYMGYPRFAYGGYSFMIVDPWPESWAENWYATDDVYVGYDDGYYLYNRRHPGFGIALTVVL